MPKEDGVHNYHFGQIPEMPWKLVDEDKEREIKMRIQSEKTLMVKDIPYNIWFQHYRPSSLLRRNLKIRYGTVCTIYPRIELDTNIGMNNNNNALMASVGKTYLHPNDEWDEKFGEKEALKRALSTYIFAPVFNRQQRKLIWQAWFNSYSGGQVEYME